MKFRNKTIQIALAILMAGVVFSCENSLESIREITIIDDTVAALRAFNIDYTRTDSGRIQVRLISSVMDKYGGKAPYTEFPEGFEVIFYDSSGYKTSVISANYGIMYEHSKNMRARNDVVVKNFEKDEKLFTENLFWDRKKKEIRSGTFVKIVTPDKIIYGDSLRADESFRSRVIYGMHGELEFEDEESPTPQ